MSEYQYYEFVVVDQPLTQRQQAELRAISTRAEITATSFVNEYHWGDLKADPRAMVECYFDAHLYLANWGTRHLMLRLPARLVDLDVVGRYCVTDAAGAWTVGEHLIVDIVREDEYDDWDIDARGFLASIIPARADVAAGDLRLLYLAWLRGVQSGLLDDYELEPPVPVGLHELPASLTAAVEFLCIDADLLTAAAAASPLLATSGRSPAGLKRWVVGLPQAEKDAVLRRLVDGDVHLRAELLRRYQDAQAAGPVVAASRTVGEIVEAAGKLRSAREHHQVQAEARERARREAAAAAAREHRLDELAADVPGVWKQVDELIAAKKPREYDMAVKLLVDLRALADRYGSAGEFRRRVAQLRTAHARKPSLLERLDRVNIH